MIESATKKNKQNKKNIVILGAGYCGMQVAKRLAKHLKSIHKTASPTASPKDQWQIILIDRASKHIYVAELYEISAAYYDKQTEECITELGDALSFPVKVALKGEKVHFIQDEVIAVDHSKKSLQLKKGGRLPYEYLVLAAGSVTNYYGIPGLKGNVYPLKTLTEALKINCDLEHLIKNNFTKPHAQPLNIIIGGGGFTGVELACELANFIKKLSKKYRFSSSKVTLKVIQSLPEMVGLGKKVSDYTLKRFKALGVDWYLNTSIVSYEHSSLKLKNNATQEETVEKADMIIWTAGVMPNPLLKNAFEKLHSSGCIETKPTLEALHYPHIYAGGDNAAIRDPKADRYLPKIGQLAIQQGVLIADNIAARIENRSEQDYKPTFKGFVIQLGGKYAIYCKGKVAFGGVLPWLMRKAIDLYYYLNILPLLKALKKWWKTENIFLQND